MVLRKSLGERRENEFERLLNTKGKYIMNQNQTRDRHHQHQNLLSHLLEAASLNSSFLLNPIFSDSVSAIRHAILAVKKISETEEK